MKIILLMFVIISFWIFFQFFSPLRFHIWIKSMFRKGDVQDLKVLLKECVAYLEEKGCNYQVCYGTLLGTIREGDLIPWDNDVDILILEEDEEYFIECMKKRFGERFQTGSGLHRLFNDNNLYIDFYVYTKEDNYILPKNQFLNFLCQNFKGIRLGIVLHKHKIDDILPFNFIEWNNCKLRIPNQPVKVLEECYGKDWMIPQKW